MRAWTGNLFVLGVIALAVGGGVSTADAQFPAAISRVSVAPNGGTVFGNSSLPALSHDGRFVAFSSDSPSLVSGDTNENRDVFVRDLVTGVTERVSLTWKGQEARGDSYCPSISGDGRYVAFQSVAWNLYAGGANLGNPQAFVYVRDRIGETTTRITVGHDGSEPDGYSGCPSISGDGSRVVFASAARNLILEDPASNMDVYLWDGADGISLLTVPVDGDHTRAGGWSPVISGDGNVVAFLSGSRDLLPNPPSGNIDRVYVIELDTGEISHESVSTTGTSGSRRAKSPAISDDGRFVTFISSSRRGLMPLPPEQRSGSLYIRDRDLETLSLVTPALSGLECGPADARFPCRMQPVTSHSISGDGRYVVFSTRSTNFLPESHHKADQVFAWDRVTGRLRRLSVDETSLMGDGCSLEPAISGDGRTVAYRTNSTNLAPGGAEGRRDVVESAWRCLADGSCRAESACPAQPQVCEPATRSKFVLARHPPGGSREDRVSFRWQGAPQADDFPDPTAGTEYHVCLYAGQPLRVEMDFVVPSEGRWRELSNGYHLVGGSQGVSGAILRNGQNRSRITVKGKGPLVDAPDLPLVAPDGVTVQVHEIGGDRCFSSVFGASDIRRNLPGDLSSALGRDGRFAAQIP